MELRERLETISPEAVLRKGFGAACPGFQALKVSCDEIPVVRRGLVD
jgi:hypothetical protein